MNDINTDLDQQQDVGASEFTPTRNRDWSPSNSLQSMDSVPSSQNFNSSRYTRKMSSGWEFEEWGNAYYSEWQAADTIRSLTTFLLSAALLLLGCPSILVSAGVVLGYRTTQRNLICALTLALSVVVSSWPRLHTLFIESRWDFFFTQKKACAIFMTSFIGGVLMRFSGGLVTEIPGGELSRILVFAVPTGAMIVLLSGSFALGLCTILFLSLGRVGQFECYHDIFVTQNYCEVLYNTKSPCMFDWLLGECLSKSMSDRRVLVIWGMCGMYLKGIVSTLSAGIGFSYAGFGWHCSFSGSLVWLTYGLGHSIPSKIPGFGQGNELSEFFHGSLIWFVYLFSLVTVYDDNEKEEYLQETDPLINSRPFSQRLINGFSGFCVSILTCLILFCGILFVLLGGILVAIKLTN